MKRNFIWIKALLITLILALALSVVGCNNTDEGTNPDQEQSESLPIVTYFKISGQRTVSTTVGQTYQISFIDLPDGASDYVVFSVQGDSVTVSSGGLVTAVKAGQATVTASYGKLSDSITVTVSENTGSGDNSGSGESQSGILSAISGTVGDSYTVDGTVVAINAQSFLIKDSGGMILVYRGSSWTVDVAIGDSVRVSGITAAYGNAVQFDKTASYEKLSGGSFTQPTPEVLTSAQLDAYSTLASITPRYIKLTAKLTLSSDEKYYNLKIDGASITGSITYPTSKDSMVLKTLSGATLEVTGYITGSTSGGSYLSIIMTGYEKIADPTPDSGSGSGSASGSTSTAGVVVNGITIPEYTGASGYYVLNGNTPFFTEDELKFTGYKYSALDSLGRATGAVARLTRSLMPTDAKDSISHIKPTGWVSIAYPSLNLQSLYNRSHLLAHALMSDDVHKENLITGTTYMNQKVMTTFESQLLAAVKNGTDVMYRVTPIYKGNNLVASGLLLEAWSMDGGDDICFCVYLYNVQPGVVIDYATGNNWLEGSGSGNGGSGSGSGSTEGGVNGDVIFSFGANGQASVAEGTSIGATKDFTENGHTLTIYSASKVYDGARDATGISAIKVGKSDEIGSFSFNVGADVTSVIIKVAGYKANNATVEINGESYTVTTHSNDGSYTAIVIDTSEVKTVTFSTTTSTKRAMIDSIEFVVTK